MGALTVTCPGSEEHRDLPSVLEPRNIMVMPSALEPGDIMVLAPIGAPKIWLTWDGDHRSNEYVPQGRT